MGLRWLAAVLAPLIATSASASWPERPVTLVVPFAPGGITDTLARITAERLQTAFSRPFVVENQAGAAGVIATERVSRAEPDGYTLLFATITQIAVAPFTHKITYDPVRDFKPVSIVATSPFVVTTDAAFPANTLPEFIAYVKASPGQLTYGAAGMGSLSHVASAVFLKRAGLDMTMVPYRGLALAFNDLLGGNVKMVSATPVELKPFIESKKLKPLGSSGPKRSAVLPDVPAIAEFFPGHDVVTWNGVVAPAKTPQPIIDALAREIIAAQNDPEFEKRLKQIGVDPAVVTPAEFEKRIAADLDYWRKLIPDMGLQSN
jgi:tripartite-type tricarboxylate transporter receptor subunit TctC